MTLWLLSLRDGWPIYAHRVIRDRRETPRRPILPLPIDAPGFIFSEEIVTRVWTVCGIETDPRLAYGLWEMDDAKLPLQPHSICEKCLPAGI